MTSNRAPVTHTSLASHRVTCQVLVENQMSLLGLREIMLVNVKLESATKLVLLTRGRAIGERSKWASFLGTEGTGGYGLILLPPRQVVLIGSGAMTVSEVLWRRLISPECFPTSHWTLQTTPNKAKVPSPLSSILCCVATTPFTSRLCFLMWNCMHPADRIFLQVHQVESASEAVWCSGTRCSRSLCQCVCAPFDFPDR